MPALPLDKAGPYVAAAYVVFLALILVYVAIMAFRLARIERQLDELRRVVEDHPVDSATQAETSRRGAPA